MKTAGIVDNPGYIVAAPSVVHHISSMYAPLLMNGQPYLVGVYTPVTHIRIHI